MKTLKLFNAVLYQESKESHLVTYDGIVIESGATWLKSTISKYYEEERLNGNDLNKTFHKSWQKIKESSRFSLLLDQIRHYISTYGSNFQNTGWC